MSDPATGDIKAKGIAPQTDFTVAAAGAAPSAKPYTTFAVKQDVVKDIVSQLGKLKTVTDDAKITKESLPDGGTKYSFIDTRDNQPLAIMRAHQGAEATLTLYKSPEALAKRIDSRFVSVQDIKEFIQTSGITSPQFAAAQP